MRVTGDSRSRAAHYQALDSAVSTVSRNYEIVIVLSGKAYDDVSGIPLKNIYVVFHVLQPGIFPLGLPDIIKKPLSNDLRNFLIYPFPGDPGFIALEKIGVRKHVQETDADIQALRKVQTVIDDLLSHAAQVDRYEYLSGHRPPPPDAFLVMRNNILSC
jgi:hypothetical protein